MPNTLKKAIVVFNVEADRHDDMMACPKNREPLIKEISATVAKGLGVVVLAPASIAADLRTTLGEGATVIETKHSWSLKLVRAEGTEDLPMYWVGSCTQNNFISGIGEHQAMMVGYAKNADKDD